MKKIFLIFLPIAILVSFAVVYFYPTVSVWLEKREKIQALIIPKPLSQLTVHSKITSLTVADTEETRNKGLSGKFSLPEDQALLFIFDKADYWGIWMKDMLFSIDILWLDKDFKVISIASQVRPDSYPTIFKPEAPATYVLETYGGFANRNGIIKTQQLDIK